MGFPSGSNGKESACNAGDPGQAQSLGWEDPREKEMATHFSILNISIHDTEDRGAWQAIVYEVSKELDTTEQLTFSLSLSKECRRCCALYRKQVLKRSHVLVSSTLPGTGLIPSTLLREQRPSQIIGRKLGSAHLIKELP